MRRILLLSFLYLLFVTTRAQTYLVPAAGKNIVTTCNGKLYDNGGSSAYYSANSNGTLTIYPADTDSYTQLNFELLSTESFDELTIYNGINVNAPQIGRFSGTDLPGTITATNPAGALTLNFYSDNTINYPGFQASISCSSKPDSAELSPAAPALNRDATAPGYTVTATCNIINKGNNSATLTNTGIYLSTDTVWNVTDTYLGSSYISYLGGNTTAACSTTVTIPANTALGNYYIIFYADRYNAVKEPDETNNYAHLPIIITTHGPDLTASQPNSGRSYEPAGGSIAVNTSIVNKGLDTASTSNFAFYLSTDSIWDPADTLLLALAGNALAPGAFTSTNSTVTIPGNQAPGDYYILCVADYTQTVAEMLETNNYKGLLIHVAQALPDINTTSFHINQTIVAPGGYLSGSSTVVNTGGANSQDSKFALYLSADTILDPSDSLFYQGSLSSGGAPGAIHSNSFYIATIPASTSLGHHYVIFAADYLHTVTEISETNNNMYMPVDVVAPVPDLVLNQPNVISVNAASGDSLYVSATIYNYGTSDVAAGGFNVGYYFSDDTILNSGDIFLGSTNSAALTVNSYYNSFINARLPQATVGLHYIIYFADYQNQVAEYNENNNTTYTAINVTPRVIDFKLTSPFIGPATMQQGATGTATCLVYNNGSVQFTDSTQLGFYISADTILDSGDRLIDSTLLTNVVIGNSFSVYKSLTIPFNTAPGNYYLIFAADKDNKVAEPIETNNTGYKAFTVIASFIDLTPYTVTSSLSTITPGTATTIGVDVLNQGTDPSTVSKVGIYISTGNLDSTARLIDSIALGAVAGNTHSQLSKSVTIPANTPTGYYNLYAYVDFRNQVAENNENNNVDYVFGALAIQFPMPDLYVSTIVPIFDPVPAGQDVNCSGEIDNDGTAASPAGQMAFYLSTSTDIADSITLLSTANFGALPVNGTYSFSQNITIPAATPPGDYYIIPYVDYLQQIAENSEINNAFNLYSVTVTTPHIDLGINITSLSATAVTAGSNITANYQVLNTGSTASSTGKTGFYLSSDPQSFNQTMLIDSATFTSVGAASNVTLTKQLTIPAWAATGNYYIIIYADFNNQIPETSEINNAMASDTIAVTGLSATPELSITTLSTTPQNSIQAGGTFSFNFTVKNTGGQSAGAFKNAVFLSTDSTYDVGDILLKQVTTTALGPLATTTINNSALIPAPTPTGVYYLLFFTDNLDNIHESIETDNIVVKRYNITGLTAIESLDGLDEIKLWPNPASNQVNISITTAAEENITLRVLDVTGKAYNTSNIGLTNGNNNINIPCNNLVAGLYFIQITDANQNVVNLKFSVAK